MPAKINDAVVSFVFMAGAKGEGVEAYDGELYWENVALAGSGK